MKNKFRTAVANLRRDVNWLVFPPVSPENAGFLLPRKRALRTIAVVVCALAWLAAAALSIYGGGIRSPGLGLFFVVILVATVLLGGRAGVLFACLSALAALGLYYAENRQILPEARFLTTPALALDFLLANYLLAGALLYLAGYGARAALLRARRELAEHEQAEAALAQANMNLAATLSALPDLMFEVDRSGRIYSYHSLNDRQLFVSPQEFLGKAISEVLPGEAASTIETALAEAVETGYASGAVYSLPQPNGLSWFELSIAAKGDPKAAGARFIVLARDITQRKLAETALRDSEIRYRAIVEGTPDLICRFRQDSTLTFVNEAYCRYFGRSREELTGRPFLSLIPPEEWDSVKEHLAMVANNKAPVTYEHKVLTPEGEVRWQQWTDSPILGDDGEVIELQSVGRDITERKRMEEMLFEEKERAQVTLHSIGDAVITASIDSKVEYLNPVAENLTGWKREEALGMPLDQVFCIIDENSRQPVTNPVERCLKEGRIVGLANHTVLIRRDGQEFAIADSAAPIYNRHGDVIGVVLVFHDVTEERRLSQQVAHDAMHDSLTGLVNRREFEKRLERALFNTKQQNVTHVLCYLDLDQFKIVNDTAGHEAGDMFLKEIPRLVVGLFRQRDTFARLGGDEFGLLLENCQLDKALVICNELKTKIRSFPFVWAGHGFQIGASIGVVPVTPDKESVSQLLSQADIACYSAKDLGRDRIYVYHDEDSETIQRHSEIQQAARIRDVISNDQFRLFCQPIVDVSAGEAGMPQWEVLLRMVDFSGNLVLPSAFIPSAERYGLMSAIDRWVIRQTLSTLVSYDFDNMLVNINLSGNSLGEENLLDFVLSQLKEFSISPERICFEITETAAIHHLHKAQSFIIPFRAQGGRIALDDFGSGFSSFRYLKSLPVDYIKIDGVFVSDMVSNPGDQLMVEAITQIAHTLGIKVIAEHASTQQVIRLLQDIGVDYVQGYGIGLPVPVEQAWRKKESSHFSPEAAG